MFTFIKQFFRNFWHVLKTILTTAAVIGFFLVSMYASYLVSKYVGQIYGDVYGRAAMVGTGALGVMFLVAAIMTIIDPHGRSDS